MVIGISCAFWAHEEAQQKQWDVLWPQNALPMIKI